MKTTWLRYLWLGGAIGAAGATVCLATIMLLYLLGGVFGAIGSVDPDGTIPSAIATPFFYFLLFLVPTLGIGFAVGGAVGLAVAFARARPAT